MENASAGFIAIRLKKDACKQAIKGIKISKNVHSSWPLVPDVWFIAHSPTLNYDLKTN